MLLPSEPLSKVRGGVRKWPGGYPETRASICCSIALCSHGIAFLLQCKIVEVENAGEKK